MRILFFADRTFPNDHSFLEGVVERRIASIGKHKVTWVMYGTINQNDVRFCQWHTSKVITVPAPAKRDPISLLRCSKANRKLLADLFRKVKPGKWDVIVVRNDIAFLRVAFAMRDRLGIPVGYQLSHFKEEELLERCRISIPLQQRVQQFLKGMGGLWLRESAAPQANFILCISDAMRSVLRKKKRYRAMRMHVFPLGYEPAYDEHLKPDRGIQTNQFRIIYVGTMAFGRRLDITLRAFARVSMRYECARLLLIGGGRELQEREKLKKLALTLGIQNQVAFLGQISRTEVFQWLHKCDVGISAIPPTRVFRTISPTKVMEYMGAGLAVVATRGILEQEELISASKGGSLVTFDEIDIADALAKYFETPGLARKVGKNGQKYIFNHRNYDKMARRFVSILNEESNNWIVSRSNLE